MKEKIDPFESLRGIAAVAVALYHFRCESWLTNNPFITNAELMVDFFFVLSGFVICYNYGERLTSLSDAIKFQKKRFWRLYPLHLVTLIAFLGIETAKYFFEKKTGASSTFPAFSISNAEAFIQQLFLFHAVIGDGRSFNYPSWSISTEFFTYLLFAILTLLGKRLKWLCFVLMITISSIWVGGIISINIESFPMIRCIFSFFLGALGWLVCKNWRPQNHINPATGLGSLILSIIAVCYVAQPYQRIICPLLFLVTVISIYKSSRDTQLWRILSFKPLVFLGTISYSIYMIHAGFWWLLTQILRFGLKVPTESVEGKGTYILLNQPLAFTLALAGIALIIAISYSSYRFIESPFRKGFPPKY